MDVNDLDPDYRRAWVQLISNYNDAELIEWSEDHLIYARTYIGRELSTRALAENPDATKSLLQEESPA